MQPFLFAYHICNFPVRLFSASRCFAQFCCELRTPSLPAVTQPAIRLIRIFNFFGCTENYFKNQAFIFF